MQNNETILLGHGSGGRLTHQLIQDVFQSHLASPYLSQQHDGAHIQLGHNNIAFTTDSFVISPLFFPNGDIGKLSVTGTINDLAMCGARPLYLSCAFIIEEGMQKNDLKKIAMSMREAAELVGAQFVAGDTKVVERGKGDGLYINVSGIGLCESPVTICPQNILAGDKIILSGDIGRHGMAIMAMREGLEFESSLESDCAELWSSVQQLLKEGVNIHCLRDLTRGGLSTALVELAEASTFSFLVNEANIPICSEVQGACEIIGLDPMYVANEGRFIAFVPESDAEKTLNILIQQHGMKNAKIIGEVLEVQKGEAQLINVLGNKLRLSKLPGDQLPRIC